MEVEVGGIESFFSFALFLQSFPFLFTSFELMQGPVGQGGAKLHACESGAASEAGLSGHAEYENRRNRRAMLCFSSLSKATCELESKIFDGEEKKKKGQKATLRPLLLFLVFFNFQTLSAQRSLPCSCLTSRTPGDKGKREKQRAGVATSTSSIVAAFNRASIQFSILSSR